MSAAFWCLVSLTCNQTVKAQQLSGSLLFCAAQRDQFDLLTAQLDLELIAWLEVEHRGVGLTHHEIAVELDLGGVAQLAATFTSAAAGSIGAKVHTLSG